MCLVSWIFDINLQTKKQSFKKLKMRRKQTATFFSIQNLPFYVIFMFSLWSICMDPIFISDIVTILIDSWQLHLSMFFPLSREVFPL